MPKERCGVLPSKSRLCGDGQEPLHFNPTIRLDQFQEVVVIFGRTGEYVLSRPGRGQPVQNRSPVLVRVTVGDPVRQASTPFPRLGTGRSPVVRVEAQFGDALDFFFRIRHKADCSLFYAAGPRGSRARRRLTLGGPGLRTHCLGGSQARTTSS